MEEPIAGGDVVTDDNLGDVQETANIETQDIEIQKDDVVVKKPTFNRSVSCGSILQGNGINKIKNLSRRVSFPSDDKLISGYNEPRNPWEHAHGTTTEDLIQAYTEACQSWNVRPITKLLLQLQEIRDFTVRASSLTLKGEKLEMRVVETLESIFKRVQFHTIDLEATNLDEDAGASLFDMIEYYESAVNVLVGFNKNLGNRGWQAAAHMMRKMSCLRLFDGHSVPLSIQASPFVGRALRLSNTLVTLHLENTMLSGRPLLLIVAALRMNTTLKELFLADNRFSATDALQLANLLKFNRILQLLDLRNNPIQDLGLGHLCAGLMTQSGSSGLNGPSGGLQTLVLWNNQISHEGMGKLAMALRYTVSLSTLNLGQNVLGDDGMLRLKEGLLQNHSLLRLGLVGTKLTCEGAVAVAEYLAESPRIIRVDLRNNDIKVGGLMALSLAFKINNSLLRLDIDKPNKKDTLKELAAKQESLLSDIVSYAARNKQLAMEKAQAAQARQEEARRAQMKEDGGLRYMDMTNSPPTTSTSTDQTSANNSNNQIPDAKGAASQKLQVIRSTVADDTPENSPEFLPRSSVSYHQVAPVMLSNSEMAKRAAEAAKLSPVEEHSEEESSLNGVASGVVSQAYIGAKETLAGRRNMSNGPKFGRCGNFEVTEVHDLSTQRNAKAMASREATRQESLDRFANKLTEVVLSGAKMDQDVAADEKPSVDTEEAVVPNGAIAPMVSVSPTASDHIKVVSGPVAPEEATISNDTIVSPGPAYTSQEENELSGSMDPSEAMVSDGATAFKCTSEQANEPFQEATVPSEVLVNQKNIQQGGGDFIGQNQFKSDQSHLKELSADDIAIQNLVFLATDSKSPKDGANVKSECAQKRPAVSQSENNANDFKIDQSKAKELSEDDIAIQNLVFLATAFESPQEGGGEEAGTAQERPEVLKSEINADGAMVEDNTDSKNLHNVAHDCPLVDNGVHLEQSMSSVQSLYNSHPTEANSPEGRGSVEATVSGPATLEDAVASGSTHLTSVPLETTASEPLIANEKVTELASVEPNSVNIEEAMASEPLTLEQSTAAASAPKATKTATVDAHASETELASVESNCGFSAAATSHQATDLTPSEDITSGVEDNSIISNDLSPLDDRISGITQGIDTGLLTPDSGVMNFDQNLASNDNYGSRIMENGPSTQLKHVDINCTTRPQEGDKLCELTPNDEENQVSDDGAKNKELLCNNFVESQCEIEVSHYDLDKFPAGD